MKAVGFSSDRISDMLGHGFLGNSLRDYAVCAVAIVLGLVLVKLFHILVMTRLRKWFEATRSTWDDLVIATLEANAVPALYILVIWLGLKDLYMMDTLRHVLWFLVAGAMTVLLVRIVMALVNQGIRSYWQRHAIERTEAKERSLHGITTIAKIVIWVLAAILLLDNLGIKVSAFMAGLGITGIAVALAAQTILGDLFGYFVIFFDQPFEPGHFIKVGDYMGEVEHIGLKTTRLRSLSGEQIVLSNKFLTDSNIQNFKRMVRRRVVFNFEVEYGTSEEALRAIPGKVKDIVTGQPATTFDRAHFQSFADSGLRFEAVYYVEAPEYNRYMDIHQAVNLELYAYFSKSGISFAFPTRTLHIAGQGETAMRPGDAGPGMSATGQGDETLPSPPSAWPG